MIFGRFAHDWIRGVNLDGLGEVGWDWNRPPPRNGFLGGGRVFMGLDFLPEKVNED